MSTDAPFDLGPLEADFATLHEDLARIAATKLGLGNAAIAALDQILQEGQKAAEGADVPIGTQFQSALLRVLKDNASTDMHGNLGFKVDQESLLLHGQPVFEGAVAAAQAQVQSILDDLTSSVVTSLAAAAAPAEGAPEGKAPPKQVKLKLDLTSMFSGLLKSASAAAKGPPKKP